MLLPTLRCFFDRCKDNKKQGVKYFNGLKQHAIASKSIDKFITRSKSSSEFKLVVDIGVYISTIDPYMDYTDFK